MVKEVKVRVEWRNDVDVQIMKRLGPTYTAALACSDT